MSCEWVDAPVGGVSYKHDQRGSASNERGGVSFERDRGQIPIVVDGHGVHQTGAWQLISAGGQLRISEVSFECDQRVVMGGHSDVPQTDVSLERDRRVVVGRCNDVPQTDASCRVVGGTCRDAPGWIPGAIVAVPGLSLTEGLL